MALVRYDRAFIMLLLALGSCAATATAAAAAAATTPSPVQELVGPPLLRKPNDVDGMVSQAAVTPAQSASPPPPEFVALLDAHNAYRAKHQAPPLSWDTALAAVAEAWARQCKWSHSEGGDYGENLYARAPANATSVIGQRATDSWYAEVAMYNFASPGWIRGTGHFTQVVWVATRRIGCAVFTCNTMDPNMFGGIPASYLVCNYGPGGNDVSPGEFAKNVLPVKGGGGGNTQPPVLIPGLSLKSGATLTCRNAPELANAPTRRLCVLPTGTVAVQRKNGTAWTTTWRAGRSQPRADGPFTLGFNPLGVIMGKGAPGAWQHDAWGGDTMRCPRMAVMHLSLTSPCFIITCLCMDLACRLVASALSYCCRVHCRHSTCPVVQ
jgi:uncharacterized protein YkwD